MGKKNSLKIFNSKSDLVDAEKITKFYEYHKDNILQYAKKFSKHSAYNDEDFINEAYIVAFETAKYLYEKDEQTIKKGYQSAFEGTFWKALEVRFKSMVTNFVKGKGDDFYQIVPLPDFMPNRGFTIEDDNMELFDELKETFDFTDEEMIEIIKTVMRLLTRIQRNIFQHRIGIATTGEKITKEKYANIAKELGVTKQNIYLHQRAALKRIMDFFKEYPHVLTDTDLPAKKRIRHLKILIMQYILRNALSSKQNNIYVMIPVYIKRKKTDKSIQQSI